MNEQERNEGLGLWWTGRMALDAPTLFDRLGGAAAIAQIVTKLYERTSTDPELAPYFHTTDMELQRRKLSEMIGEALGGRFLRLGFADHANDLGERSVTC